MARAYLAIEDLSVRTGRPVRYVIGVLCRQANVPFPDTIAMNSYNKYKETNEVPDWMLDLALDLLKKPRRARKREK